MKSGIHPEYNNVVFVDIATKDEVVGRSTMKSGETREIDGVEHFVIKCDITSYSHPFYTGKQKFVDRAGRVEKFQQRYNWAARKAKLEGKEEAPAEEEAEASAVVVEAEAPAAAAAEVEAPVAEAEAPAAEAEVPAAES
jgi:large subunit ribosomal protein L31